jgi:TetR/AcrR family transcriptional repressor of nem operon
MARPRKIAHDEALSALQTLFWRDGYSGVSTRKIEDQTGLTKFTLQTSYGGKKALFLETLDRYLIQSVAEFLPLPEQNVLEGLATWFEDQCEPRNLPTTQAHGCLLLNTITEFERGDKDADQRIAQYFSMLRHRFGEALEKGIKLGEVDPKLDVASRTELLVGAVLGLNMIIRSRSDTDAPIGYGASIGTIIREWHT